MDEIGFKRYLEDCGDAVNTINTRLATVRRVEKHFGDLDTCFVADQFSSIQAELTYSASDERRGAENPSRIQFDGDLRSGLASCRTHLNKYGEYLGLRASHGSEDPVDRSGVTPPLLADQTFGLERDLQRALRSNIEQLEPGLRITDGSKEHRVEAGFIDILARDENQSHVVIELKSVPAKRDALAQLMAYMGDLLESTDTGTEIRGILIAPSFDAKTVSAARVVPSIKLVEYSFTFSFHDP